MDKEQLRMQMLAGVITEGEYKAKLEENDSTENKDSLNENFVGMSAINSPFAKREKETYEDAFEHFLSERYQIKPNRERDDIKDLEEDKDPDVYESEEIEEDNEGVPNPSDKLEWLEDQLTKLYKMGKLEAPVDIKKLAKTFLDRMFDGLDEGKEVEEPNNY